MSKGIHDKPLNYDFTYGHEMQFRIHSENDVDVKNYVAYGKGAMIDLVNEAEFGLIPHMERKHRLPDGAVVICKMSYGVQQVDIYPPGVIEEEMFFALYAFRPKGGYPQAIIAETKITEDNPSGIYLYFDEDIQAGPANSQDNTIYNEERNKAEQHNNIANRDVLFSLSVKDTSCAYHEGLLFHKQYVGYPSRFNINNACGYSDCFYGANCEKVYAGGHLLFNLERDLGYEGRPTLTYRASIIGAGEFNGYFILVYMSAGRLNVLSHKKLGLSYSGTFNKDPNEPLIHFSDCENIYSEVATRSSDPTTMCTFTSEGGNAFFHKFYENTYASPDEVQMEKIELKFETDSISGELTVKVSDNELDKLSVDSSYIENPAVIFNNTDYGASNNVFSENGGWCQVTAAGGGPYIKCQCVYWGGFGASGVCSHDLLVTGWPCEPDHSIPRDQWYGYSYQLYHGSIYTRFSTREWGGTGASEETEKSQDKMMFLVGIDGINNKDIAATVELAYKHEESAEIQGGTSNSMNVDNYPYRSTIVYYDTLVSLLNEALEYNSSVNSTTSESSESTNSTTTYSLPWDSIDGSSDYEQTKKSTTYRATPNRVFIAQAYDLCSCRGSYYDEEIPTTTKPTDYDYSRVLESERYVIAEGSVRYGIVCAIKVDTKTTQSGDGKGGFSAGSNSVFSQYMTTTDGDGGNNIVLPTGDPAISISGTPTGSDSVVFPYRRIIDFSPHPKGYALMSMSNEKIVKERESGLYDSVILLHNKETGEDLDILEKYNELLAETIIYQEFTPVEPIAAGSKLLGVSSMFDSYGVLSRVPKPKILPKIEGV